MASQLHLLAIEAQGAQSAPPARKVHRPISARSQAVGRRGLAKARAALQAARQAPPATTQRPRPSSTNHRRRSAA